jgi:CRP/FNR family transcriptional regulator
LKQVAPAALEHTCATCNLRETCLSVGMPQEDLAHLDDIAFVRRRIARGECLFHAGDEFTRVHAVLTGIFKTVLGDREGRDQVTGFSMDGDLLGMDGLASGSYRDSAIALEDSDVCAMPYATIADIAWKVPSLQRRLRDVFAHEIGRSQGMMLLLGSMNADERLATFLVTLSRRLLQRGRSGSALVLRMTREEIGSYLGLKLETVSRSFSAFQRQGLINVSQRQVTILEIDGLERLLVLR